MVQGYRRRKREDNIILERRYKSLETNKYIRHHDKDSDTYSTEAFNFLNNTSLTNISRDKDLYQYLKKNPKIREVISADAFNNVQFLQHNPKRK